MTKKEIQRELEAHAGGALVSIADVCRWSGRSPEYIKPHVLQDLECVSHGKNRLYYSGDIAAKIATDAKIK